MPIMRIVAKRDSIAPLLLEWTRLWSRRIGSWRKAPGEHLAYRPEKAAAMACFFLEKAKDHRLNDLKLMKLLYIAERESLRIQTATMSGSTLKSMPKGPVLSEALNNLCNKQENPIFQAHIKYLPHDKETGSSNQFELIEMMDPTEHFSKVEVRILGEVWRNFKDKSKWELVDLTHEFPEWDPEVVKLNTSRKIRLEDIFQKALKDSEDVAKAKVADIKYYEELSA